MKTVISLRGGSCTTFLPLLQLLLVYHRIFPRQIRAGSYQNCSKLVRHLLANVSSWKQPRPSSLETSWNGQLKSYDYTII
ncbi:hypothetical protein DPMN_055324 [Dreissena polymorpha]|uniref:Uncharacterized protein n=1 Tax=Dreissena polymorpha TaxID=45954 RepID=A0A9D4HSE8_DREPO|nr:hypothetical protein DPMN_055324 [Dreissena polymorpha]